MNVGKEFYGNLKDAPRQRHSASKVSPYPKQSNSTIVHLKVEAEDFESDKSIRSCTTELEGKKEICEMERN